MPAKLRNFLFRKIEASRLASGSSSFGKEVKLEIEVVHARFNLTWRKLEGPTLLGRADAASGARLRSGAGPARSTGGAHGLAEDAVDQILPETDTSAHRHRPPEAAAQEAAE